MRAFLSLTAAVLAAIGIGLGALAAANATTSSTQPVVHSIDLPSAFQFYAIQNFGTSTKLQASYGAQTSNDCASTTIETSTLAITLPVISSCNNPFGSLPHSQRVTAVTFDPYSNDAKVRIALGNPVTHRVSYGPVVMTYSDASDTHLMQTYGDGSLWVFDTETPQGAVVLRISPTTGVVENRIKVPEDPDRPMLVTNDDGLWMAVQVNGGYGNGSGRGAPIYHISPGSNTATVVHRSGYGAFWIVASGHRVWVDVPSMPPGSSVQPTQELWSFEGQHARVVYSSNISNLSVQSSAGDGSGQLYALVAPNNTRNGCSGIGKVMEFDPLTGQPSQLTALPAETISAPYGCQLLGASQQMTIANGSLYVLYGATSSIDGYESFTKLYQIGITK